MKGIGEGTISKLREFINNGTIKKFEFIEETLPTKTIKPSLEKDMGSARN